MVFAQVELKNGVPFAVNAHATDDSHLPHVPNAEALAAIQKKPGKRFRSPDAFLAASKSRVEWFASRFRSCQSVDLELDRSLFANSVFAWSPSHRTCL
jgi:hypothetical protein